MSAILLKFWPYIVIALLVAALSGMGNLYLGKRDELTTMTGRYDAFVSATKVIGEQATVDKAATEAEHLKNLTQVKDDHENQVEQVRNSAVAQYLAAHPASVRNCPSNSSGSSAVRGDGPGLKLDDGASQKCVPDEAFIQDAADDAVKVGAWIEYCQLNKCPVKQSEQK